MNDTRNTERDEMLTRAAEYDRRADEEGETETGAWYRMSAENLRHRAAR